MSTLQNECIIYIVYKKHWSFCMCVLYSPPFNAPNQEILAIKVKEGKFRPIPSHYSAELQAVINKLLKVDVSCNVFCLFDQVLPCISLIGLALM